MTIAIIGAGNIGSILAQKFIKKGHSVLVGVKFPLSANSIKLATVIGEDRFNIIEQAVKQSQIIIIAVPLKELPAVAEQLGDVTGKIIIETTNAFGKPLPDYSDGVSAIKEITGNRDVVKCFNSIGAENMANPAFGVVNADMFVAGDSKAAKEIARQLAMDTGFANCYDLGGDEAIPVLESLAVTWGVLAFKAGLGRRLAFKILTDKSSM